MSLEEAAEEIMRGPFSVCTNCEGTPNDERHILDIIACRHCHGTGKWRRGDYVRACIVLGKKWPEQPYWIFDGVASGIAFTMRLE